MPSVPVVSGDPLCDYAAYSDESHSDGDNTHMVIGGILCRSAAAHRLSAKITELVNTTRYRETLGWKYITKRKVDLYKRIAEQFFRWRAEQLVDFSCIVFDSRKVDHRRHSADDPEAGFFKFVYQHHLAHQRRYRPTNTFRCFHGNMDTRYNMAELKGCLNGGTPNRGLTIYSPYMQVEFAKVRETRCLQISDILIGAVGFVTNGGFERYPASPKAEVAGFIQELAPVADLAQPTSWPDRGFAIWHFKLD